MLDPLREQALIDRMTLVGLGCASGNLSLAVFLVAILNFYKNAALDRTPQGIPASATACSHRPTTARATA